MDSERIENIKTRWTLVRYAHQMGDAVSASEARQQLVLRYLPAVRRYVGAIMGNTDEADDLAQEFSLRLMKGDFAGADPHRGRFRDLLKTAVRNMVRKHWEKSNRRRPVEADLSMLGDSSDDDRDAHWTAAWQQSVLDQTWARMLAEDQGSPSPGFRLLKLRVKNPDASSEELAEELSRRLQKEIKPDTCRQMLKRARHRFAAHLLDEIKASLDDESDERVQQELADLGLLTWFREKA
ncbi:MAG TPA: sigma-70 family RNA polymerase sigma factor [Pirellulaceae bacterium]|nr:sigma-70 family RNA polymerase sigma factor [Pirellulaceae bacterium]